MQYCRILLVLAATAALATRPALAQRPGLGGAPVDMRNDARVWADRERRLRTIDPSEASKMTPEEQRAVVAAVAQLQDDFHQIQIARNEMADVLHAEKGVDFGALASKAREINKRAKRLQQYLAPDTDAAPETEREDEPKPLRVRNDAVVLCHTIAAFVENPAVVSTGAIDSGQAAAAVRDLQRIVDLSERVRKSAERLAGAPR